MRQQIQPYEVASKLRNEGKAVTAQDVRKVAERLNVGRVVRRPHLGLVFNDLEVEKIKAALS